MTIKPDKKRSLDELRQVKTYGYTPPEQEHKHKESVSIEKIKSLISVTPNDMELGEKVRKLFFIKESTDTPKDTNIFGKISGSNYKDLIENYQNKKGVEFTTWYGGLTNEEKIFITSMFD
tara:strand:+ start:357 stop:716 length:360 start_codon:yes stop_codon:yes gene_type:complete